MVLIKKSRRGFAGMDPEKHKAISSHAGKRSQELGHGHRWNKEEAKAAVQKREENKKHEE
jgi:uncharacterized protein